MSRAIVQTGLCDERQVEAFYLTLSDIYEQIRTERRIDVFGNLDFEVVRSIDGKKNRIAKLKGSKILVHVNARLLPKSALRYVIAHEIAHTLTKRHTRRFWKVVKAIDPKFEIGQSLLMRHGKRFQAD